MEGPLPRVLVGCPTCDLKGDSLNKYFEGLDALTYPNFDVALEDNSETPAYARRIEEKGKEWLSKHPGRTFRVFHSGKTSPKARERLVQGRNLLRDVALKEGYDCFLSLEQDVVLPSDGIERLLARDKDVVSATYFTYREVPPHQKFLVVLGGVYATPEDRKTEHITILRIFDILPSRLMEVAYAGLGAMLIRRRALEKAPFRYDPNNLACDDIYFCSDTQEKGFPTFLDTGVLCAHHFNRAFKQSEF